MQPSLLRTLRNRNAPTAAFRRASRRVCPLLVKELKALLKKRNVKEDCVIVCMVLRSAIAFLDAAMKAFPSAPVAMAGLRRDEKTAIAEWYYENFPRIAKENVVVLFDPMLATAGSAAATVRNLIKRGADPKKIYFVGVIGAVEGVAKLSRLIPRGNIVLGAIDPTLDARKFIVPGLGDYGDRYFGYGEVRNPLPRSRR